MRTKNILLTILALLSASEFAPRLTMVFAQGTAFTYQGRLNNNGQPANGFYDVQFLIFDATNNPGTIVSGPITNLATIVSNGLFTVLLDFGPGIFDGADRWLEIAVRTNGTGGFATLNPRQALTPAPYAIFSSASVSVSNGIVQNPSFLGTRGNLPFELFAGSQRALRLEPNTNGAPNVIAGSAVNQVASGTVGATISGGGTTNYSGGAYSNRVSADFGAVGGGVGNSVG